MTYNGNSDMIKGDKVFIFIGGVPVAYSTSAGLDLSKDTIDTANKMSGGWATSMAGKKSWSASTDALLTKLAGAVSFDTLYAAFNSDEEVTIVYGLASDTFDLSAGWYTGKAHITSLGQKSEQGSNVSCSATFTGTGPLTPAAIPVVAVKAAQSYTAGSGFKQLLFTVDGVEFNNGGVWEVSTAKSGVGVTKSGEIFADAGTTSGTIGVKVTYGGVTSAAVNVTISV